jgi:hypothetical protein
LNWPQFSRKRWKKDQQFAFIPQDIRINGFKERAFKERVFKERAFSERGKRALE